MTAVVAFQPVARERLAWSPAPRPVPAFLCDSVGPGAWTDLGKFSAHLRAAGVLDLRAVDLPGSMVLLPHGVELVERLAALVEETYRGEGFDKYDYPALVPGAHIDAASAVLDLERRVLWAHDERGRVAALTPSGEEVIYEHWRRSIRTRADLPIQMFRRGVFFRPASRGGQSVFRALEARDVFELHGAYPDAATRDAALARLRAMYARLCARLHLPTLWSTRPPWGNNAAVSARTLGGDVFLPCGSTVQVACLYEQGQRFSAALGITYREGGRSVPTEQLTGAVSRRLLWAHLLLGLREDGALTVHPELAPLEVAVHARAEHEGEAQLAERAAAALSGGGVRARAFVRPAGKGGELRRQQERQGVPLIVALDARPGRRRGLRLSRSDSREEAQLAGDDAVTRLVALAPGLLAEIGDAWAARARAFHAAHVIADGGTRLLELLRERRVALVPLAETPDTVATVAAWRSGEVLGFLPGEPARCALTGGLTTTRAYVAPRV